MTSERTRRHNMTLTWESGKPKSVTDKLCSQNSFYFSHCRSYFVCLLRGDLREGVRIGEVNERTIRTSSVRCDLCTCPSLRDDISCLCEHVIDVGVRLDHLRESRHQICERFLERARHHPRHRRDELANPRERSRRTVVRGSIHRSHQLLLRVRRRDLVLRDPYRALTVCSRRCGLRRVR